MQNNGDTILSLSEVRERGAVVGTTGNKIRKVAGEQFV